MSKIIILCIEDEAEVREALARDLAPFRAVFRLETAEDAEDARSVLRAAEERGDAVGLILCDHLLPGQRGVDFLIELHKAESTASTRKVLITGQAGLDDTIRAINEAGLHHYIAKPWTPENLHAVVRNQLTEFVLAEEEELLPYVALLDSARLLDVISKRKSSD
ncbi:MAG TPA: response regulator [Kiritimatiellia bacterium]|nr:response regulator [Kiritimatiellia bacterium]